MIMSFCSTISSQRWSQPDWPQAFLFLVLFPIFFAISVSSSPIQIIYRNHCDSVVSESSPTQPEFTTSRLPGFKTGYYSGGDPILGQDLSQYSSKSSRSLSFRTRSVYGTKTQGVFKIEARLQLLGDNSYYYDGDMNHGRTSFPLLQGFWSESSRKLCMVGSGSVYSKEGELLHLAAVLKLSNVNKSSTVADLVTGTLESLNSPGDSGYFEPISILVLPETNYKYTMASEAFDAGCPGGTESLSLSTESIKSICSLISREWFELEYASKCNPSQNCTPFGGSIGYFPQFISTRAIQCSEDEEKLQVLIKFLNNSYGDYYNTFDLSAMLIGEGSWDLRKKQLCLVGCRILNTEDSLANAHVGDCSIRMSLRFPAILSIRDRSSIVGQIWSTKSVTNSDYFSKIMFRSPGNRIPNIPGLKYEYTEIEKASKLCQKKKPAEHKGVVYPNGHSLDKWLDMSVRNSTQSIGWSYSSLIAVGDKFYDRYAHSMIISDESEVGMASSVMTEENSLLSANANNNSRLNVGYQISLTLDRGVRFGGIISPLNFSGTYTSIEIAAEGSYDANTGCLCMVGCLSVQTPKIDSVDCEILVNLQFPSLNSKNGGYVKGSIESTRKKSDPLYFEHLDMSASIYSVSGARQSIWRMDFETIMVLVSHTLSCVFVGLQLLYVKKRPEVLPSITLVMLVVLTLGYMIPLVLNFEALFLGSNDQQNIMLDGIGWLKVNEVIVRVFTMVVFLLQFRLLQLTWSAKLKEGQQKGSWIAEKRVLYLSLPLYVAGFLIPLVFNRGTNEYGAGMTSHRIRRYSQHRQHSHWQDLRSYAGLLLDGFLFPQILLNIFTSSCEKALAHSFYVGTTAVRSLPHAYDLYRAHNYVSSFNGSYIYANPGADFYSTAWDIIIPCGGLLFCAIIFLQQRFGGGCILPKRFRQLEAYEKIPVVSSEQ